MSWMEKKYHAGRGQGHHVGSDRWAFLVLSYPIIWAIGMKLRQFRTLDELDRPQSLFHDSK
jgi:hypothetical protein